MIHIGFDLKLFGLFPEEDDKAVGSAELAQKTGADRSLLGEEQNMSLFNQLLS